MNNDQVAIHPIKFAEKDKPIVPFTIDKKKDPEKRLYVVLYYSYEDGEEVKSFEILTGRTNAREFIKNMIDSIDIHESKILVETVAYEDALTVYQFIKEMEVYYQDGFDIEDYNIGDYIEIDKEKEEQQYE